MSRELGKYYRYSKVVLYREMREDLFPDLVQIFLEKVYVGSRRGGTWRRFQILTWSDLGVSCKGVS